MFGLSSDQYEYILKNVVYPLERLGAQVWCFGSRARGDFKTFSDLDLMVEFNSDPKNKLQGADTDISSKISQIAEKLSHSNFPYKVELVLFSQFAESYKPGYFRDRKAFSTHIM